MRVVDTFQITGRGLAVTVAETTSFPVGKRLAALVIRPDETRLSADAFKEWLLRRTPDPLESEAFLLVGLTKEDVPVGSELRLTHSD